MFPFIASEDYSSLNVSLSFSSIVTNIDIDVPLIDDDALERNEIFQASLAIITVGTFTGLRPDLAEIIIVDDDQSED